MEEEEDGQSGKRNRTEEEEDRQVSDTTTSKRAKVLPRQGPADSERQKEKENKVFEHTKEGEEHDAEVTDTAKDKGQGIQDEGDEDDEVAGEDEREERRDEGEEQKMEERYESAKKQQTSEMEKSEENVSDQKMEEEEKEEDMDTEVGGPSFYSSPAVLPSREEVEHLRDSLVQFNISRDRNSDMTEGEASSRWSQFELLTTPLTQDLCEQLRLILEPTKAAKLRGDFKTGKRLNMKRIIPYIASRYQKDKIWLRRTKPSARDYQVMVALDDSKSMDTPACTQMSIEAVAVLCGALSKLEIGRMAVCGFGSEPSLVVPFTEPFTAASGARILRHFNFTDEGTDIISLLSVTRSHFLETSGAGGRVTSQIMFIVSDGRGLFVKGVEAVKKAVKETWDAGILVVFLIIDNPSKDSILNVRTPVFDPVTGKLLRIQNYLETFPFPYYVVLRDPAELPLTLADALRQWIEMIAG
eukprot:sb/3464401/